MSVEAMSRLRLVGLKSDKIKIMRILTHSGRFELSRSTDYSGTVRENDASHLDKIVARQVKVSFAIDFLYALDTEAGRIADSDAHEVKKGGKAKLDFEYKPLARGQSVRAEVNEDDFNDIAASEYELLAVCEALEKISFRKADIKSERAKLRSRMAALEPFAGCPLPFSFAGTSSTSFILAYAASNAIVFEPKAEAYTERFDGKYNCIGVITARGDEASVRAQLSAEGFTVSRFDGDFTAAEAISECRSGDARLEKENIDSIKTGLSYAKYLGKLKVLYDCFALEIEKAKAEFELSKTASAFIIEGWVPKCRAEETGKLLSDASENIVYRFSDPAAGEQPPTMVVNPAPVKPFEDITNLYSPPAYGEFDPNPVMAVFFFLFFGFMVADAGYGLLISIAALFLLKRKRFESGTARLIALIGICGISTVGWGVVTGGIFGISGIPSLWFNPIEDPITMLAVAIVMGVIELLTGYGIHAYKSFKKKEYVGGILDVIFVFTLFIGVGILVLGMLVLDNALVQSVGTYAVLGSIAGMMLAGMYGKKGIGGKLGGAFSGLYGIVNILSDVLSYIRLFGLGLASGAIALAFNTLGGLLFGIPVVGYPLGIIVLIPLHAFNLGLSLLSAYVHNARLQFIEFYGKFYDGGGRLFSPMGRCTKYIVVKSGQTK